MDSSFVCPVDQLDNAATDSPLVAAVAESQLAFSFLSRLQHAAEAEGISCLASSWDNWQASYPFACRRGHQFVRSASFVVQHRISCPECRDAERLAQLNRVAESKGGRCLETAWRGGGVRHQFQCARGHVWQATPRKVNGEGSWCRRCAQQEHGKKMLCQDGLARLQEAARLRGGQLLDTVYGGMYLRYRFSCSEGHHWQAEGGEIARGSWCKACANENKRTQYRLPDGLARLHAAAQARQGVCLSPEYTMARDHYRFRCHKGHEWQTTGNRIFRGAWCPSCAHDSLRLGIDQMRELAEQRGGRCVSEHYKNSVTKLRWECHRGHQWDAIPGAVTRGHWCAACAHMDKISNPRSKARGKYVPTR
jgi:hypothetical protein